MPWQHERRLFPGRTDPSASRPAGPALPRRHAVRCREPSRPLYVRVLDPTFSESENMTASSVELWLAKHQVPIAAKPHQAEIGVPG